MSRLLAFFALAVGLAGQAVIATSAISAPGTVSLLAVGDIVTCENGQPWPPALATEKIVGGESGIVLGLGDLAYPAGTFAQYRDCFTKAWGPIVPRIYPVPGNHDYKSAARGYDRFWGSRFSANGHNYSFDYGAWHIVALDSETSAAPGSALAIWLQADLAAVEDRCTLAFFHRPAFSTGQRSHGENAREIFAILVEHGVAVTLSGHNHFYERTALLDASGMPSDAGTRSFVVGTGGRDLDAAQPALFDEALITGRYGVLQLDLSPRSYAWRFLATDGKIYDRGTADCRPVYR
ncbi:MAG: metallophosphoesterase [Dongiaceae bacterium]